MQLYYVNNKGSPQIRASWGFKSVMRSTGFEPVHPKAPPPQGRALRLTLNVLLSLDPYK
jgi:hypothetical protein